MAAMWAAVFISFSGNFQWKSESRRVAPVRLSKILDFGALTTRRRRWTRSSGNKLQTPLSRRCGFLFASRLSSTSIFRFARFSSSSSLFFSLCLPLLSIIRGIHTLAHVHIHARALARTYACCSVTLRGNAASRNMWPWTSLSRGFLHGNREKSCWPRDAISYTAVYLAKREK